MESDLSAKSSFKACLFDLDGVLVDSMGLHYQAWREVFAQAGARVGGADFKKDFYLLEGAGGPIISRTLLEKYPVSNGASSAELLKAKNDAFLAWTGEVPLIEGQKELLAFLKSKGIRLALVTGSVREVASALVARCFPGDF
jgi:beta-phosphoglucomutase